MDDKAKEQFKWKFYRLTVEINITVLLVAVSILVFFLFHSPLTMPAVIGLLVIAFIVSRDLIKKYQETKKWLDNQEDKEKEHKEKIRS